MVSQADSTNGPAYLVAVIKNSENCFTKCEGNTRETHLSPSAKMLRPRHQQIVFVHFRLVTETRDVTSCQSGEWNWCDVLICRFRILRHASEQ